MCTIGTPPLLHCLVYLYVGDVHILCVQPLDLHKMVSSKSGDPSSWQQQLQNHSVGISVSDLLSVPSLNGFRGQGESCVAVLLGRKSSLLKHHAVSQIALCKLLFTETSCPS